MAKEECPYEHDATKEYPYLGDCDTCIHDRLRDCAYGIYRDTIIIFASRKGVSDASGD